MDSKHTQQAYDFLRQAILAGEYQPGTIIKANAVAERIGISRTPVRDSMRKLENDGLLILLPGLGAKVRSLDLEEFCDLLEMREALESFVAAVAARKHNAGDLAQMEHCIADMETYIKAYNSPDCPEEKKDDLMRKIAQEDLNFHLALIDASRNRLIKEELLRMRLLQRVVLTAHRPRSFEIGEGSLEEISEQHRRILEAVQANDAERASRAMAEHIGLISRRQISLRTKEEKRRIEQEFA